MFPKGPTRLKERAREFAFMGVVAVGHLVIVALLFVAASKLEFINTSPKSMSTVFLIAETQAASHLIAAPSEAIFATDAPTLDVVSEQAPRAPILDLQADRDPFAGAAPTMTDAMPTSAFSREGIVQKPLQSFSRAPVSVTTDPLAGTEFKKWLIGFRAQMTGQSAKSNAVTMLVDVFAQPTGGFTNARIGAGSGDAALDREVIDSIMQHQELISYGAVVTATWLTLPSIELQADSEGP